MIILHGGWQDGWMLLWAERSPDELRPKGNDDPAGNDHPYCADPEELVNVLTSAAPGFRARSGEAVSATAWLPSRGGSPLPSSALVADPPRSRAKPRLMPWSISAYRVSPTEAIPILQACKGQGMLTNGVGIGVDLAYWSQAVRFGAGLVARQQFLPGTIHDADGARAAWVPLFIGVDAERLARLSQRMPASARALSDPDAGQPPDQPAATVLRTFVAAVADNLVRKVTVGSEVTRPKGRPKKSAFDSVHDAWLSGLKSADGAVHGTPEQLGQLRTQVMEWQRPISVMASAPFRVCFRLEEPPESDEGEGDVASSSDGDWYLRYLLQSHEDRSLLLPASAVWKTGNQRVRELERDGFNPREFLLTSLGQASGVCAGVAASLQRKRPAGRKLDAATAYQFLTRESIALEEAGYGIILPAWWTRRGTKTKPTVRANVKTPQMQGGGGVSLSTTLELNLEVALGDQVMTARELEALAQLKTPLVRLRGQWVELNASEIRAALDFWNRKGEATLKDVIRLAVGAGETPGGFDVDGVAASGWVEDLLGQLTGRAEFLELEAPEGFCGTLRPYQQRGYSWLAFLRRWGLGACLADDMGLGKTVQTLAAIQQDRREGVEEPTLLVCPTSVLNNWRKEAARFTPDLPLMMHHGPGRKRDAEFVEEARQHAIVMASYGVLARDVGFMAEVPWRGIVLDEAQNIKNPATRQAWAARSLGAEYRVALTGTPVENHVGDLWSVMQFLNPGLLGTESEFKRNYFIPIQAERDEGAAQRLQRATGPFILRRLKTDRAVITDLPEKAGEQGVLPPDPRAGHPVRGRAPGGRAGFGRGRRHRAPGSDTRHADQVEAGLQPPPSAAGGQFRHRRPVGQTGAFARYAGGNHRGGRPRPGVQPVCRDGRHPAAAHPGHLRPGGAVPAWRSLPASAGPDGGAVPGRQERAAGVHPVAARRRDWAEPDGGQPRLSLRPLVEPRRGEPGHGPGLPHRPDQQRAGAQVHVRRHPGGADRYDD